MVPAKSRSWAIAVEVLTRIARPPHMALETELPDGVGGTEAKFLGRVVVDLVVSMHHGGGSVKIGHMTGCAGEKAHIDGRQAVRRMNENYGRDQCVLPCNSSIALRRRRR